MDVNNGFILQFGTGQILATNGSWVEIPDVILPCSLTVTTTCIMTRPNIYNGGMGTCILGECNLTTISFRGYNQCADSFPWLCVGY